MRNSSCYNNGKLTTMRKSVGLNTFMNGLDSFYTQLRGTRFYNLNLLTNRIHEDRRTMRSNSERKPRETSPGANIKQLTLRSTINIWQQNKRIIDMKDGRLVWISDAGQVNALIGLENIFKMSST